MRPAASISILGQCNHTVHGQLFLSSDSSGGDSFGAVLVSGLAYGLLHIIGPDHLGTLISLAAAAEPRKAFFVGAAWGLGHAAGMASLAGMIVVLQKAARIDIEAWDHVGDYVIGTSMVLCGLYFVLREDRYLQESQNGTVSLRGCSCHSHLPIPHPTIDSPSLGQRTSKHRFRPCSPYGFGGARRAPNDEDCREDCRSGSSGSAGEGAAVETSKSPDEGLPLTPQPSAERYTLPSPFEDKGEAEATITISTDMPSEDKYEVRSSIGANMTSALIGIFQGLCCPVGMVGMALMANLQASEIALFIVTFLLVSVTGTGIVSCGWSFCMRTSMLPASSTRMLYRGSCCFTFVLGVAWIVANYFDLLDKLNYAEHSHELLHPHVRGVLGEAGMRAWHGKEAGSRGAAPGVGRARL